MKVRELIQKLQNVEQEKEILFEGELGMGETYRGSISSYTELPEVVLLTGEELE